MDMTTTTPASDTREFDFGDRDFKRVCDLIYQRVGISLAPAKRDMVYGRLSRRLRVLG
ncbi:chemotaxis protein CheR, partial [Xanthomonas vesicatoria]